MTTRARPRINVRSNGKVHDDMKNDAGGLSQARRRTWDIMRDPVAIGPIIYVTPVIAGCLIALGIRR
jgi:hypothetical protein